MLTALRVVDTYLVKRELLLKNLPQEEQQLCLRKVIFKATDKWRLRKMAHLVKNSPTLV